VEDHMEEGPNPTTDAETPEETELRALVLGFLRQGPSKHPSASRIAQAIGRSPREVIDELARLSSRGELPVPAVEVPAVGAPGPVTVRTSDPVIGTTVPVPPRWDRSN
jgi:hypothetical protein